MLTPVGVEKLLGKEGAKGKTSTSFSGRWLPG